MGPLEFVKRTLDLALGSAALILLSPLMIGLAVAIKLTVCTSFVADADPEDLHAGSD